MPSHHDIMSLHALLNPETENSQDLKDEISTVYTQSDESFRGGSASKSSPQLSPDLELKKRKTKMKKDTKKKKKVFTREKRDWIRDRLWGIDRQEIAAVRAEFLEHWPEMSEALDGESPKRGTERQNNRPYSGAELMFFQYHKNDLKLEWMDVTFAYMAYFDTPRMSKQGPQGRLYRSHNTIPLFAADGRLVKNSKNEIIFRKIPEREWERKSYRIPVLDQNGLPRYKEVQKSNGQVKKEIDLRDVPDDDEGRRILAILDARYKPYFFHCTRNPEHTPYFLWTTEADKEKARKIDQARRENGQMLVGAEMSRDGPKEGLYDEASDEESNHGLRTG